MKLPLWSYWVLTCLTPHKGFHFQCPDTWKVGTYFFKLLSFIASVSLYTSLKTLQHKSCLLDLSVCKFCTVQVNKIKPIKRKIFITFQAGYVRLSMAGLSLQLYWRTRDPWSSNRRQMRKSWVKNQAYPFPTVVLMGMSFDPILLYVSAIFRVFLSSLSSLQSFFFFLMDKTWVSIWYPIF